MSKTFIKMYILHADKGIFLFRKQKVLYFHNHNSCSVRSWVYGAWTCFWVSLLASHLFCYCTFTGILILRVLCLLLNSVYMNSKWVGFNFQKVFLKVHWYQLILAIIKLTWLVWEYVSGVSMIKAILTVLLFSVFN